MNNVRLEYALYSKDIQAPIKLKGSKLQIARLNLTETKSIIHSIADYSMKDIQYSRYTLLTMLCKNIFAESEYCLYLDLQLNERLFELLRVEINNGCFSAKDQDDEVGYYGAWKLSIL